MARMSILARACLFAFITTATQPLAADEGIPPQFVGKWATSPAACGPVPVESIVRITAGTIETYASAGRVVSVSTVGDRTLSVVADYLGENDETWRAAITFRLSADGARLARDDSDGLFHRCPDDDPTD